MHNHGLTHANLKRWRNKMNDWQRYIADYNMAELIVTRDSYEHELDTRQSRPILLQRLALTNAEIARRITR